MPAWRFADWQYALTSIGFGRHRGYGTARDHFRYGEEFPQDSNLIARRACSLVIGGWGQGEQTVQYEGEAEELGSPELERYQETYFKAFPDGPARMSWPGIVYFVVRPRWIRYSDFDQNPPLLCEFEFPRGR